jgi:hypothetical protein
MTLAAFAWTNVVLIAIFTVGLLVVILVPFVTDLLNTHTTYRKVVTENPHAAKVLGPPSGIQGAARATMAFAVITVIGFALAYVLVQRPLADNGKVVNTIVVALTTTLAAVTAFYFGSKLAADARRGVQPPLTTPTAPVTTAPAQAVLTVTVTTPADGATYMLDDVVNADYSCSPSTGAQIVSLAGPVPSGSPIDTSKPGSYPFAVTASDSNRQSLTTTNTYTVAAPGPP